MYPRGEGVTQKAIALAMRHPMGVGDARFHLGRFSGYVDTVYLGTFRKNLFQEIGLYDPNCRTNEDAELNVRMLKRGNKIYLDSRIQVTYFPRKSFRELGRQYFRYGRGRCYTTLKHKRMTSLRQAASPALVLFLVSTVLLGLWKPLLFLLPLPYFFLLIWSAMRGWRGESVTAKERLLVIPAFFVMHICWGTGFLSYLLFPKKSSPENGGGTEAHG
jgi:GT2 family glycosyltransferase